MRSSPVLAIAACAAVALTCVLATASASATVLCAVNKNPCTMRYKTGENITGALAAAKTSVFENALGDVTCTKSQFTGVLKGEGGNGSSPPARFTAFTLDPCTRAGGEKCTATATNLGAAEAEQWASAFQSDNPATGNGLFSLLWNSLGAPGFYVVCGKVIDCKFTGASSTLFTVTGGKVATFAVSATMNTAGATCPANKPTWKGTWELSSPSPLFLEIE